MDLQSFRESMLLTSCLGLLILVLGFMFLPNPSIPIQAADCINADCNGSGQIDIDDVVLYMSHLFIGVASPCEPCEDILEVGKWYVVEDTAYSRSGMFSVGDSVFSFLDRWITKDLIYIKSLTSISGINVDAWLISDTAYLGLIEYYLGPPDTIGVGIIGGGTN